MQAETDKSQCGNCKRAGRSCPGYRSEIDVNFVDETPRLHRRHMISDAVKPLTPSIDDYALACFYNIHMLHPGPRSNSRCRHIVDASLLAGMKAMGLAAQATMTKDPSLAHHAFGFYGTAIQQTSAALRSKGAKDDATLLAVLVLTHFEALTGQEERSAEAWRSHVEGTTSLIAVRGPQQMKTNDGRMLFMGAAGSIFALNTRLKRRLPEHIHAFADQMHDPKTTERDVLWSVSRNWMRLIDFYSDVSDGRAGGATATIAEAVNLDERFAEIFAHPSPQWSYQILRTSSAKGSRGDLEDILHLLPYIHLYHSALAAQIWASMRHGRLVLQMILQDSLRHLLGRSIDEHDRGAIRTQLAEVITTSEKLRLDILASVPQFIGLTEPVAGFNASAWTFAENTEAAKPAPVGPKRRTSLDRDKTPRREISSSIDLSPLVPLRSDKLPVLRTSRSYNLVWALTLVAQSTQHGSQTWRLAIKSLRLLGRHLGMMMAIQQADKLEREGELSLAHG